MILAQGARGPGFNSQNSPCKWWYVLLEIWTSLCYKGLFWELNPGPLAPEARIMPLDQTANDTPLLPYDETAVDNNEQSWGVSYPFATVVMLLGKWHKRWLPRAAPKYCTYMNVTIKHSGPWLFCCPHLNTATARDCQVARPVPESIENNNNNPQTHGTRWMEGALLVVLCVLGWPNLVIVLHLKFITEHTCAWSWLCGHICELLLTLSW